MSIQNTSTTKYVLTNHSDWKPLSDIPFPTVPKAGIKNELSLSEIKKNDSITFRFEYPGFKQISGEKPNTAFALLYIGELGIAADLPLDALDKPASMEVTLKKLPPPNLWNPKRDDIAKLRCKLYIGADNQGNEFKSKTEGSLKFVD